MGVQLTLDAGCNCSWSAGREERASGVCVGSFGLWGKKAACEGVSV